MPWKEVTEMKKRSGLFKLFGAVLDCDLKAPF